MIHADQKSRKLALEARKRRLCRLFLEPLEPRICLAAGVPAVPAFSSLPGADHTVFLDFDGDTVTGTSWNAYYSQNPLIAQPYDLDGDTSSFSATELSRIERAWQEAAEDFRPFEVNVTTVEPPIDDLRKSGVGDSRWGVRAIMTRESTMVDDPDEYCSCGGIAYINSFNWSSDTPVWVYNSTDSSMGQTISHEVGHSLGLSHDGTFSGGPYYRGHGIGETSTGPIMGAPFGKNVVQWNKGEYFGANNAGASANYGRGPDDLDIIATWNGFSYRPDDHGDNLSSASLLSTSGNAVDDSGIIETTSDIDLFRFTHGGGPGSLTISPFTPAPNLDVRAALLNSSGRIVALADDSSQLEVSLSGNAPAGTYYLGVDGTGWGNPFANPPSGWTDYGSLGQYFITGTINNAGPGDVAPTVSLADVTKQEDDQGTTPASAALEIPFFEYDPWFFDDSHDHDPAHHDHGLTGHGGFTESILVMPVGLSRDPGSPPSSSRGPETLLSTDSGLEQQVFDEPSWHVLQDDDLADLIARDRHDVKSGKHDDELSVYVDELSVGAADLIDDAFPGLT